MGSFSFVLIPCETGQAVSEQRLQFSPGTEVECLLGELRNRLTAAATKPSVRSAHGAYISAQTTCGSLASDHHGPVRLVRSITLLANSRANDYIGVNMYIDGSSAKSSQPENFRASELCRLCGHKQIQVRGDAYVARLFDDDDNFERLDFHPCEVTASAPWVAMAAQQRIGRLREPAQTILARIRAYCAEKEAAQEREPTAAEQLQDQADAAFKAHNHAAAADLFGRCADSAGPQEQPLRLSALSHRALALLKLRQPAAALADCEAVLSQQPHNTAALYRKAAACRSLGRREDAQVLLRLCLEIQPQNEAARSALGKLEGRAA